ncbi:MAG: hypothetical protein ABI859_04325 [Pseudomonadota bacterium]
MLPRLMTSRRSGAVLVASAFGAGLLLLLARTALNHVPMYDELLHILAARGLIAHGDLRIDSGLYLRAELFTRLVAMSLGMFGDTLTAARLPSLAAAVALVMLVAGWVTRRAGLLAGLVTAGVLCLLSSTVELAAFARFYSLHAFVIALIGILAYESAQPDRAIVGRAVAGSGAVLLLPLAWHLQSTTAIAALAIAAGVLAVIAADHLAVLRRVVGRHPLLWGAGVLAALVVGAALFIKLGLYEQFRAVPGWAAWAANKPQYYLFALSADLPLLWPLSVAAALLAWQSQPRLTLFCIVVFVVAFSAHSIAAAKSMRYLYYAMPFLCIVWGCAISASIEMAGNGRRGWIAVGLAIAMLGLSVEGQRTARMIAGRIAPADTPAYELEPDWSRAVPALAEAAGKAQRVITSNSMRALYYLGRYDYELHASIVAETETGTEFGVDPRTGRRAISTVQSLRSVIDMPGSTLIVLEDKAMHRNSAVSSAVVQAIDTRCAEVSLPREVPMHAWVCDIRVSP